ncbi:unnamed protein product, partial [marine sediment metagenome]
RAEFVSLPPERAKHPSQVGNARGARPLPRPALSPE